MLGLPFLLFFFPLHLVSNSNTHSGRSTRAPVPRIFLRSATPIRTRRDSQAGRRLRCAGLGTYAEPVARIGERVLKRLFIAVFTTLLLALGACSGGSAASAPTATPSSEPPAAAPATASPSTALNPAVPANECLSGRYRLCVFLACGVGGRATQR